MSTSADLNSEQLPRSIRALLDSPYARYLELDELFDIQAAASERQTLHHPEEVLFRSVHMTSELWLRLASYELERARDAIDAGHVVHASRLVERAVMSVDRVIEATGMLETMPAADYHVFRVHFGEASGLQSPGYAYLRREARTLAASLDSIVASDDELLALYTSGRADPRYALSEALLDLDATLDRFRQLHMQIARRFLGDATGGTGGTQGVEYLRGNVGHLLFPRLWAIREQLAKQAGTTAYGYGNTRP